MQSTASIENYRLRICRYLCASFAVICVCYGALALCGALLHMSFLQNQTPWGTLIKANPALCLMLCGVSVLLGLLPKIPKIVPICLACLAALISGITLMEWIFNWDAGIDQILASESASVRATAIPGRMAANAAVAFFALSIGAALSQLSRGRASNFDQILGFITFSIGQFALLGHAFGLPLLKEFWGGTEIAYTMSIMLSVAGCSLLLLRPGEGHAKILVEPGLGGIVIRRLLPWIAIIPFIGLAGGVEQWKTINLIAAAILTVLFLPLAVWRVATTISALDDERAEALQKALSAKEEALEAAANRTRFAQLVSHEVRTPLSGVVSLTELLSQEPLEGETKEIAESAYASSKRLMQVLNELLDMQSVEAKSAPNAERFNIRELIAETVQLVEVPARTKKLAFSSTVDSRVPAEALGDPLRIRQILINFCHNAIKFTENGSVTINVTADRIEADRIWVKFSVDDTGIGIEPSQQAKLFEAFTQANSSIAKRFGGTGLGLSICKQFAESIEGVLGIESTPTKGSKFWLVVPLSIIQKDQPDVGGDMESTYVDIDPVVDQNRLSH